MTDPPITSEFSWLIHIHDFQSPVHIILNHTVTELDYYTHPSHTHTLFSLKPIFISFLFFILLLLFLSSSAFIKVGPRVTRSWCTWSQPWYPRTLRAWPAPQAAADARPPGPPGKSVWFGRVLGQPGALACQPLKHIVHERVHEAHGLGGDADLGCTCFSTL